MYPHLKRQQTPPRSYPGGREDLKGEISYPGERHSLLTNIRKTPSPQKPYRGRLRQRRGRKVAVSSKVVAEWRRGETEDADVSMNDNSARVEEQWDNWEPEVGGESAGIEIGVSDERASFVASEDADASFEDYVLLVESGSLKFIRIARYIYVVQGWNARQREPTKHFYHLESRNVGSKLELTCLCPDGDKNELCVHRLFYVEFRDERFRRDEDLWFREGKTVMFWRQMTGDEDVWLNRFSVQSHGGGLKGRAIVTYEGLDNGQGTWRCARDRSRCEHIGFARAFLREVLRISEEAEQEWDDGDVGDTQGAEGYMLDDLSGGQHEERSVSYLPIMPPKWAQLPSDTVHYIRTNPNTEIPALIQLLAGQGRSACKAHVEYNPNLGKFVRECTVYGLVGSVSRSIEVQHCSVCPPRRHCLVGPDPRSLGLFNYNNSALFTHELLDEYTNRFTRSVTPFTAFTEAMAAVYESRGSKFVGEDLLREAWFAYASIQDLAKDMVCPQCGTEPENMIFDGVTSGFNKKHLNDGLCPPTHEHDDAPVRDRRYPVKPQWLPATARGKTVRSRLADWVRQNKSRRGSITSVGGEDLGLLVADLTREALPLGNLFKHVFFSPDENRKHDVDLRQRYLCLFEQLAGEESAVQMVNEQAVALMKALVACPTVYNASCLVEVPAVLMVLEAEMRVFQGYTSTMMAVCSWMINRVEEVLSDLKKGSIPPLPLLEHSEVGDWQRTGCCYGLPQIRHRPKYPRLTGDRDPDRNEKSGDRGKCAKYYSTYGERRLTGGLMCAWCTHSICYGFHCIPRGEGRNDVFSAMITRWPKAPKRVIYDFACALGPYCMTREPEFFSGTQFLVDGFHAKGHTKCSSATLLSTYTETNAKLSKLNSSAAECGNSGIGRIRKAVSYMRQNRAILFTKVFVSIWNRLRILAMCTPS